MQTAGELLKNKRKKLDFPIHTISKKLKIQEKYLIALEENDYSVFDSKAIARGFIEKYAVFLGLDSEKVLAFWRREFSVDVKQAPPSISGGSSFSITPKMFLFGAFFAVIAVFLVIGYNQNAQFNAPPILEITSPLNNDVVDGDKTVLKGTVSKGSDVFINSRILQKSSSGEFSENILLHAGINKFVVKAINKSGVEVAETISVESTGSNSVQTQGSNKLTVSMDNEGVSTFLEVKDGKSVLYNGFLIGPIAKGFSGEDLSIYIDLKEGVTLSYNGEEVNTLDATGDFYKDFKKELETQ